MLYNLVIFRVHRGCIFLSLAKEDIELRNNEVNHFNNSIDQCKYIEYVPTHNVCIFYIFDFLLSLHRSWVDIKNDGTNEPWLSRISR